MRLPGVATVLFLVSLVCSAHAGGSRIFYRSSTWLETSPAVQRSSLAEVLTAWRATADEVLERAVVGEPLTVREREALRLTDCVAGNASPDFETIQARITAYALAHPNKVFSSIADFVASALGPLCPRR
ncbi:MAG: hypothetical protein HYS14_04390 [Candidatus Rokubacteria bacterium]|nr:hypothetical protein [Candidatus Rokubacteria bacterium]